MTRPNTDEIITNKELPALFNVLPGRDDHALWRTHCSGLVPKFDVQLSERFQFLKLPCFLTAPPACVGLPELGDVTYLGAPRSDD